MCGGLIVSATTNAVRKKLFSVYFDQDSFRPSREERTLLNLRSDHIRNDLNEVKWSRRRRRGRRAGLPGLPVGEGGGGGGDAWQGCQGFTSTR